MSDSKLDNEIRDERAGRALEIEIEDELSKNRIEQLHRATLSFSGNSQETKKLCVSLDVAALTLLAGFDVTSVVDGGQTNSNIDIGASILPIGVFIPMLFWIVDAFLYYYQTILRRNMQNEENAIRKRHNLTAECANTTGDLVGNPFLRQPDQQEHVKLRMVARSLFNGSQAIYACLALAAVILWLISKFLWKV